MNVNLMPWRIHRKNKRFMTLIVILSIFLYALTTVWIASDYFRLVKIELHLNERSSLSVFNAAYDAQQKKQKYLALLLEKIPEILPKNAHLIAIEKDRENVLIHGMIDNRNSLSIFEKKLKNLGFLSKVELETVKEGAHAEFIFHVQF